MTVGPVNPAEKRLLSFRPVTGGSVGIKGGFWGTRQHRNRDVTIPYGMRMLEESGTLENFRVAAGTSSAAYTMPLFRDSDLYKVLEAIAWERAHGRDDGQERFLAESSSLVAAAQNPDGYLNTYVQVVQDGQRFGDPAMGHELYCAGHLMQAAVADARTGGPGSLLSQVAQGFADLLVRVMPEDQPGFVPGHPEVEMALVETYRTNGDRRLLDLAAELVRRRGRNSLRWHAFEPAYFQDDVAFAEAMTIRGHAVRALYLLCGVTDLYTELGLESVLEPVLSQWRDMAFSKTYITGGVGSRHKDEAFGDPYELPPDRAYCETCAAVASIMWNWRLLLLRGDALYAELMERTLYNGFLSGLGSDGATFFYENPLQVRQRSARRAWYDCACCPPNVMRLLSSLEHYVATESPDGVQLHQYMTGSVRTSQPGRGVLELAVDTAYPFDGDVAVEVMAAPPGPVALSLRVPSWASGARCALNGVPIAESPSSQGYLVIERRWAAGDHLELELPLRPRSLLASDEVDGARGCVAYERGPLVYCLEGADLPNGLDIGSLSVEGLAPPSRTLELDIAGEHVVGLELPGRARPAVPPASWPYHHADGPSGTAAVDRPTPPEVATTFTAVPYYAWGNRGASTMRVWVPLAR